MNVFYAETVGKSGHRVRVVARVVVSLMVGFFAFLLLAWTFRAPCAEWALRSALARAGVFDASFRIANLSASRVVVEDFSLGGEEPVLTVKWAEARFALSDAIHGQVARVRLRGVETPLVWRGARLDSALQARLSTLVSNAAARGRGNDVKSRSPAPFVAPVGEFSLYDLRVPLRAADGREIDCLRCDLGAVAEPESAGCSETGRFRLWADARDALGAEARLSGTVAARSGEWTVSAEAKAKRVDAWVAALRSAAPEWAARLPALPTNCSASVRGAVSGGGWTRIGPFEGNFELGRNSGLVWGTRGEYVRFQTFRVEASGIPQDVQCRVSAGVSGFRVGGGLQAAQEEGRLLGVRGSVHLSQTATNWIARTVCDADLPGRTAMQVLARVLPLFSRLTTDGGSLHVESDLAREAAEGLWQGEVRYSAEARRSAATTPKGRVGAGRVAVDGVLRVAGSRPGSLRAALRVEDAYFLRPGLSVKGGALMALDALPPYRSAQGAFEGRVAESASLARSGIAIPDGGVQFSGSASVDGLASNPVWRVVANVPEADVAVRAGGASCRAKTGAAVRLAYGATRFSLSGDAWAREVSAALSATGTPQRAEAGVERADAHVEIAETAPERLSNAVVRAGVSVRGAWLRAGDAAVLEGGETDLPFLWSQTRGLAVDEGSRLTWRRLETQGLRIVPGGWTLRAADGAMDASLHASVDGSRFGASVRARIPLADPGGLTVGIDVPEAEWSADDAVGSLLRGFDAASAVSGRASADARVRFLGSHPVVEGEARLGGVQVSRESLKVCDLSATVPFEYGVSVRTVGRPFVAFESAQAGNVRLGKGRIEFQVTPGEVFVDRAEVAWCGGALHAYSVHLDPRHPKADVDVYADRIDLGEALAMVVPFKGEMEGVLYGRFPVGVDNGHVRLSTGYLYSLPGQGGKLRLDGNAPMRALLERAGVTGEVQVPLSKALSDMDFDAIRLELSPKVDGDAVLRVKLDGKSNFKEWPAPVDLELNLHGPLEKLLNVGLDLSRKQ